MAKNILIFSDGTGQIGGLRPVQRLSNVYKMYRAMRAGPDSPIDPSRQFAFYDPGLGASEGRTSKRERIRDVLSSALGTGIDDNVIDCYAAVIAQYEPGDRVLLFGFSRGAYTVRALANVMNLCGVPTGDGNGHAVPRYGPKLRKIAADAVRYVYNHGAGKDRARYQYERETKAQRFRDRYGCDGRGSGGEPQGNVQPCFVGVFDTVAALQSRSAIALAVVCALVLVATTLAGWLWLGGWPALFLSVPAVLASVLAVRVLFRQFKYFFEDPDRRLRWWHPIDWVDAYRHGHFALWTGKHYDRYIDRDVRFLRHAQSIDEARANFARVEWGRPEDIAWNHEQGRDDWMRQLWFAGNHSDIGGSYPEHESRLSDIALDWMVAELDAAMPGTIAIRRDVLFRFPDALGLAHDERKQLLFMQPRWLRAWTGDRLTWPEKHRPVPVDAPLHDSVLQRFRAAAVAHADVVKPYRPPNLAHHEAVAAFYR